MRTEIDNDILPHTILKLFKIKEGEIVSGLMHLGTRLGLWDALRDSAPCTSEQLATATGLEERWVREWLHGLAATEVVQHEDGQFALTPEAEALLSDADHPGYMPGVFGPPMTHQEIDRTVEAFRGGLGMTWDEHGDHACHMQAAMGAAKQESYLVPVILSAFDGAVDALAGGGTIVDVGCGSGVAARTLASTFPKATVVGVDPSPRAIAQAQADGGGLDNLSFEEGTFDDLDRLPTPDLLVTLDVLHDLTRPSDAIEAAYRNLSPDGWWLVADIKGRGDLESNRKIPVLPYMYGMSVFYCMSSALSEPGGAGLGTLGMHPAKLEEMTGEAGFTRFVCHDVEVDPTNWYYEIRR